MIRVPPFFSNKWATGELATTLSSTTGITQTVGHDIVENISYGNGSDVNSAIGTSYTELVSFDIGEPFVAYVDATAVGDSLLTMAVDSSETAGDYLQAQVLVDGVVIADITVTRDAGGTVTGKIFGPMEGGVFDDGTYAFNCLSSFVVQVKRNGTLEESGTYIYMGQAWYTRFQ